MNKGDRINLKNGHVGTIVGIAAPDFIGDPSLITVQYVENGRVHLDQLYSTELLEARK